VLAAPLVAAGLSYYDLATAIQIGLLLTAGSVYAWLISLAWPSSDPPARPAPATIPRDAMLAYGMRLAVAAASAYLIAASLGLDHPGWAPAACLLVARPQLDLLRIRGIGRVVSVAAGALAGALLVWVDPPSGVYAIAALVVLAAAAATAGSRWYITSAFTTFFVFLMILGPHPEQTEQKLVERIGETMLGVGLAFVACWLVPWLLERSSTTATIESR
jgi:uncharacterized membrane protein YccC